MTLKNNRNKFFSPSFKVLVSIFGLLMLGATPAQAARPAVGVFAGDYDVQCKDAYLISEGQSISLGCGEGEGIPEMTAAALTEECTTAAATYVGGSIPGVTSEDWNDAWAVICDDLGNTALDYTQRWIGLMNGDVEITNIQNLFWFFYNADATYSFTPLCEDCESSIDWRMNIANNYTSAGIAFDPIIDLLPLPIIYPGGGFICLATAIRNGGGNITRDTLRMTNGHAELDLTFSCSGDFTLSIAGSLDVKFDLEKLAD